MTILILYFWGNLPTKMYEIVKLVGLLTEKNSSDITYKNPINQDT